MSKPKIGFIGVGLMGHGMAKNIVEKGYPLSVICHRNREPVDDLVRRGATEVKTPRAMAESSDVIFLCLNSSSQVEDTVLRADGVLSGARPGLIIADSSTSDPASTLKLARLLAAKKAIFCDAALGNTPTEAEAGSLNAFVGADAATFATLRPVIETWAKTIVHVGEAGSGHKVKLINNFIGLCNVATYAEAFAACQAMGLDPQKLHDVVRPGGLYNGMFERITRWVTMRDPKAHQFRINNCLKDVTYFNRMVEEAGMTSLLGHATQHLYMLAKADGYGDKFMPRLVDVVSKLNGLPVKRSDPA